MIFLYPMSLSQAILPSLRLVAERVDKRSEVRVSLRSAFITECVRLAYDTIPAPQ